MFLLLYIDDVNVVVSSFVVPSFAFGLVLLNICFQPLVQMIVVLSRKRKRGEGGNI